jgi:hypothetical protein
MINKNKQIEIERDIEKEQTKKALKKMMKRSEERGRKLIEESFDDLYLAKLINSGDIE